MASTNGRAPALKLSICIPTFNRASFIGATLESILPQLTSECELVVLDGGSTDDTERVVLSYSHRFARLRYVRQETNNGFDRDCDRVVLLSEAEYCWLMADDDLIKPNGVATVLDALRRDLSLIIVNAESRDLSMEKVLQERWLGFETDRVYAPSEMDRLFGDLGDILTYVGCVIIKREIWLTRDRERFFGSLFVYLGVIFQRELPGETLVVSRPLVSYRMGNLHTFSPKIFETFMFIFPKLVWSLSVSDAAKNRVCSRQPWKHVDELLMWRGFGMYSLLEYQRLIRPRLTSAREAVLPGLVAAVPGVLVNAAAVLYYSITRRQYRGIWRSEAVLQALRQSRCHFRNWWLCRRGAY